MQKKADGAEQKEKFVYARIMTYEKRNGRCVRVAKVSTAEQLSEALSAVRLSSQPSTINPQPLCEC